MPEEVAVLTLGLSCHPCGMLSRGGAASLLIQLSAVLSVWSSVVIHSFTFEQGYDELLVPSEVAKLLLMPFQRGFYIFWSSVDVCSKCLCGFSWSCQQLVSPQSIAAVHRGIWWSHLPFPGKALGDCFSPCLLGRFIFNCIRL